MQIEFKDGQIHATLTYDELIMWMIVLTSNVSPSSILEKQEDEAEHEKESA